VPDHTQFSPRTKPHSKHDGTRDREGQASVHPTSAHRLLRSCDVHIVRAQCRTAGRYGRGRGLALLVLELTFRPGLEGPFQGHFP